MDKVNFSAGEREGGLGHLSQRLDEFPENPVLSASE